MKNRIIVHPILYSTFVILSLFSHNVDELTLTEMIGPFVIVILLCVVIWGCLALILHDMGSSSILVTLLLFMFFSYGHFYNALQNVNISDCKFIHRNIIIMPVWILIISLFIIMILKNRKRLDGVNKFLNFATFILVVMPLINITIYKFQSNRSHLSSFVEQGYEFSTTSTQPSKDLPNIYYIILDGYTSNRNLNEFYNFDNSEFLNFLKNNNFYIANDSKSNYALTFLSFASSLNMNYINYLSNKIGLNSKDRTLPYEMIQNNKVMRYLKSKGYKFVHFSSGWGATNRNKCADLEYNYSAPTELFLVLINMTILKPFIKISAEPARERILDTFSQLAEVQNNVESPYFVFAHIVAPHPPYLFDAEGELVKNTDIEMDGGVWQQEQLYLGQLTFINKKVKILIDKILSESDSPPIIILQADHGTASSGGLEMPTKELMRERMGILNAYYFPLGYDKMLYESITPVNSFRIIFKYYFKETMELLEDKSYFSSYNYPYKFVLAE